MTTINDTCHYIHTVVKNNLITNTKKEFLCAFTHLQIS